MQTHKIKLVSVWKSELFVKCLLWDYMESKPVLSLLSRHDMRNHSEADSSLLKQDGILVNLFLVCFWLTCHVSKQNVPLLQLHVPSTAIYFKSLCSLTLRGVWLWYEAALFHVHLLKGDKVEQKNAYNVWKFHIFVCLVLIYLQSTPPKLSCL